MKIPSKLPDTQNSIFSVMSALAREHNAINLSQGFPDFDCPDKLKELVFEYMKKGHNQYAPMPGVEWLREQIAAKIEKLYGQPLDFNQEVTISAGATQAIFCAITAFVSPGDEVIVIDPAYDSYKPAIFLNGGKPVVYSLEAPEYNIHWGVLESLVTPKTRMIIINNPHNPTGTILSSDDLISLEKIASKHDLLVLSDEVYEHLVFDNREHQSVLRFPSLFARSLVTFSFGKTFHNTGWKTGYCVAPADLMKEFRKVHQFNVFAVNTPVQYALADFLTHEEEYLGLNDFYQLKRDYFTEMMKESPFIPLGCTGTYFRLFDYSKISDLPDTEFTKWLISQHGVAAIPLSPFFSKANGGKIIRFCFAKTNETLERAATKLKNV